jgi:hypothetical protein
MIQTSFVNRDWPVCAFRRVDSIAGTVMHITHARAASAQSEFISRFPWRLKLIGSVADALALLSRFALSRPLNQPPPPFSATASALAHADQVQGSPHTHGLHGPHGPLTWPWSQEAATSADGVSASYNGRLPLSAATVWIDVAHRLQ